jgi:hypothetical protein
MLLQSGITTSSKPTASIVFNGTSLGTTPAPVVAYFSSRPSTASPGILKPDVIGPGVNVIAAWPFKVGPNTAGGREGVNTIQLSTPYLEHQCLHLTLVALQLLSRVHIQNGHQQ